MGRLLRGLLLGLGLSLLFVPLRSQEMRRMIGARLRSLLPARPDSIPLLQPAQPATQQPAETVGALSSSTHYLQQAAVQSSTREQTAPAMSLVTPAEQHEAAAPPIVQNPPPPSIPTSEQSLLPAKAEPLTSFEQPEATQAASESTEDTSPTTKLPVLRPRNTTPLAPAADSEVSTKDAIKASNIPEATPAALEPVEVADPTYPTLEPDLDMTPISPTSSFVPDEVSTLPETDPPIDTTETVSQAPAQGEPHKVELSDVPGVTTQLLGKLAEEGIHSIPQLLERATNKDGRTELAHKIGLGTNALRALVSRADLMQLHDLDADTATLMQEANVTGCKDLQRRNPDNLRATLTDVQARKRLGGRIPSLEQLTAWIAAAAQP